jgi:hypothetical protein
LIQQFLDLGPQFPRESQNLWPRLFQKSMISKKIGERGLDIQSPRFLICGLFARARDGQSEVGYGGPVMRMIAWAGFFSSFTPMARDE